jgi:hypothetical protein
LTDWGLSHLPSLSAMIEDKYIGLALAVSSSLAIGTSFIITKKVELPLSIRFVVFNLALL